MRLLFFGSVYPVPLVPEPENQYTPIEDHQRILH